MKLKFKLFSVLVLLAQLAFAQKDFYELRVYDMKFGTPASGLHTYLEKALLPALNKQNIQNIGVFEENGQSQPTKIYVLIPYTSMGHYEQTMAALKTDASFIDASAGYNAIAADKAPFSRYTTSFFTAFSGIPRLVKPADGSMLFELRTYESYIEDAFRRKVKMFNEGELKIFEKTGLHSVFFGEKIAGPEMPCLTYMLAFKDLAERDANWAGFVAHPDWKAMSSDPQYANTVSNITRIFLKPLKYSQL